MKILPLALLSVCLFVLSSLLFGISGASASALLQPTSTPTWESLFKTQTPMPTVDYTCLDSVPQGWGTITPGALWSSSCGQCLQTLTPRPTSTALFPTWTPDPLLTATPTPILSATPTGTIEENGVELISVSVGSQMSGDMEFDIPIDGDHLGRVVGAVFYYETRGSRARQWWHWIDFEVYSGAGTESPTVPQGESIVIWFGNFEIETDGFLWGADERAAFMAESIWNYERNNGSHAWDASGYIRVRNTGLGPGSESQVVPIGYLVYGADPPEPTPVPATYCGEVNGAGGSQGSADIGIDLPQILVGPASCYGVSGFTVPTGVLALLGIDIEDFEVPTIQICLKPLSFQPLEMFGVSIDLDYMIFIVGAVLGIRWVLRS